MPKSSKADKLKSTSKHHPKSRKVVQFLKKINRDDHIQKSKKLNKTIQDQKLAYTLWYKNEVLKCESYDENSIFKIVERYVCRNDDEINLIRKKLRYSNSVKPPKLLSLEMQRSLEASSLKNGTLHIPDIVTPEGRKTILNWNGNYSSISAIKSIPYKKPDINVPQKEEGEAMCTEL